MLVLGRYGVPVVRCLRGPYPSHWGRCERLFLRSRYTFQYTDNFILSVLYTTGNLLQLLKSLGPVVQHLSLSNIDGIPISRTTAAVNI